MTDPRPLLLLDFDGTVCVGDGPVWAYAEAVLAELDDDRSVGPQLRGALAAYLDGAAAASAVEPSVVEPPADGYAAVAAMAAAHATPDQLDRAYAASRAALASGRVEVGAPDGLADLLRDLAPTVERVLVTNAPAPGIAETLEALRLADGFDRVVTTAGKPAGWATLLPALLDGRPAAWALAVGDVWANDVAEPLAAGCATALIDRFGHRAGPAHVTGATFEDLYPDVRAWAQDPAGFVAAHPAAVAAHAAAVAAHPVAADAAVPAAHPAHPTVPRPVPSQPAAAHPAPGSADLRTAVVAPVPDAIAEHSA